jgi:molybdenum cofactor guanylyltransferase
MNGLIAVVLAGGQARRFGSDKLSATLGELTLLDHVLAGLPSGAEVIVVGPERPVAAPTAHPVRFVREDPAGGGPAAALVAGLRAALALAGPETSLAVLPGDAPFAGAGVAPLVAALGPGVPIAVAVDADGREQPLQLGLTVDGARALVRAAGPEAGANASARALVAQVPAVRIALSGGPLNAALNDPLYDVDTAADLTVLREELCGHLRNVDRA